MANDSFARSHGRRRFRIWVAGRLDERFIDGVPGVELGDSEHGSTLEGPLVDQSQLRGLLDRLWQLGIEVLGFESLLTDLDEADTTTSVNPIAGRRHPGS